MKVESMPSEEGVEISERDRFRLRRLIRNLRKKEGRGTELISLYIPPKKRIAEVMTDLREERSTASNIKSDLTRKHVQDAITKTLERLKFYDQAPDTGLVIFCGAIPTDGIGSEKMEIYTVIPPEPVNIRLYRCDSRFHIEYLEEILEEKEVYGLVAVDTKDAAIAILEGSRLNVVSTHTSGIPGKSRAGGQSARRFERLREMEINEYFRRVSTYVNEAFLDPEFSERTEGVIMGGPGHTKHDFVEAGHLDYRIKNNIMGYVDLNYSGEEGIRELVAKSEDLLKEARYVREKTLVDRFVRETSRTGGLATHGLEKTLAAVRRGAAQTVILLDNVEGDLVTHKCPSCGFVQEAILNHDEELTVVTCPSCGRAVMEAERRELLDYLDEMRETQGTDVETISARTEHGQILEQFGEIGALLRYSLHL